MRVGRFRTAHLGLGLSALSVVSPFRGLGFMVCFQGPDTVDGIHPALPIIRNIP